MNDPGKLVGGVWLPSSDRHLTQNMQEGPKRAWRNGKLTYQIRKLDKAMRHQPEDRRRTCIDIGAHVGLWSMWLADLFQEVHAFEPLHTLHESLFHKNVPNSNVTFHPFAMGDRYERITMMVPPAKSCCSYIASPAPLGGRDEMERLDSKHAEKERTVKLDSVDVRMRTLDSFEFENVDFIKIDTEGFELFVIRGALRTIKRCKPNIVVEQAGLDAYYGHVPNAALRVLEELGMSCKAIMGPDHIMVWE